ncbi:hypothetical protein [Nonomuraea sp. NPDC002799]
MKRAAQLTMRGSLALALAATFASPASAAGADGHGDRHGDHGDHHGDHHSNTGGRCSPRTFYKVHRVSPRNFFLPRTRYIDGPGGSMSVSVTREHEVLAFLETEREKQTPLFHDQLSFTPTDVISHLRKLGLPHLEERHMVYTGHEYTREVSRGMYGNMWYRVFGYRIGWSAWSVVGTCRHRKIATGIANVPARVEGWRYWETKHPMYKNRRLPFN